MRNNLSFCALFAVVLISLTSNVQSYWFKHSEGSSMYRLQRYLENLDKGKKSGEKYQNVNQADINVALNGVRGLVNRMYNALPENNKFAKTGMPRTDTGTFKIFHDRFKTIASRSQTQVDSNTKAALENIKQALISAGSSTVGARAFRSYRSSSGRRFTPYGIRYGRRR